MTIHMTERELSALKRGAGDATVTSVDHGEPARLVPVRASSERVYCTICGTIIYQSPTQGRSSGHVINTWQDDQPPRLVPVHQDCYEDLMAWIRDGEYSI